MTERMSEWDEGARRYLLSGGSRRVKGTACARIVVTGESVIGVRLGCRGRQGWEGCCVTVEIPETPNDLWERRELDYRD